VTSQGSLRHQFQRALERGSAVDAISAAKAMGGLSLGDALALCVVLSERNPSQYHRAAGRWISRFLGETPDASLEVQRRAGRRADPGWTNRKPRSEEKPALCGGFLYGRSRDRTTDLLLVRQALSQLS
jgi:hypothetical protein